MIAQNLIDSTEFLSVISIAVFMAISPGPDFFMISRNGIMYGKTSGVYSAFGVSVAIWFHVAYSIGGLALIISKSIVLFSAIKFLGGLYLVYIGFKTLTSKSKLNQTAIKTQRKKTLNRVDSFKNGFITNVLNPKTTVFFLSIFTQIVDVNTSITIQVIYGAIISIAHLVWFYLVATFLSHQIILNKFNQYQKIIESFIGVALIVFGIKVAFIKQN